MIERHIGLNECQVIQGRWERDLGIIGNPKNRTERMAEEWQELEEALDVLDNNDTLETRQAVGDEVIDVFIIGMSIIDSLGFDAERLFLDKMAINYEKYPIADMNELRDGGDEVDKGIAILKNRWNNRALPEKWRGL